jgi:hypothetical protein
MTDDREDDEEDFDTPTKLAKSSNSNPNFLSAINAVKQESATKKRKIGPKIEDAVNYNGEEEGDEEGNGDAIDFSIGYTGSTAVKMEDKEGEIVDLTDDLGNDLGDSTNDVGDKQRSKGKGKEKVNMGENNGIFNVKVKKEVVDLGDMGEDEDDEMVV